MSTWESNYLAHFGILGQKWGVRRFQNEDGTLTEEGRKRYLKSETYADGKTKLTALTKEADHEFFQKNTSKLTEEGKRLLSDSRSDPELKKAVKILQFERNYGENWINSWNKASDIFNIKINDINDKYDFPSKDEATYRKYISEVNKMWTKTYGDTLLSEFGEHPDLGRKWLDYAIGYSQYSNADDLIDDDMRRRWASASKGR